MISQGCGSGGTKVSPLEFQPERAQGKAWPWSGCGDADVKRGSVLGRKVILEDFERETATLSGPDQDRLILAQSPIVLN